MENLTSPKTIKSIIEKYGFKFSKSLGQNFLTDANVVNKIIEYAGVTEQDYIIEIGPGIGSMTQQLCKKAKKVVAIEIDSKLIPILNENFREFSNVKIINEDILKVDIDKIIQEECEGKSVKVVANLPYYVTTPIIIGLLEKKANISSITIMIQKEVADRITAKPKSKNYGILSITVHYFSIPKIGFTVSSNCFMPQPKIDSIIIRLDILKKPSVKVKNEQNLFKLIKASFGQRRKTLLNCLINSGMFKTNKEELKKIFKSIGLNEEQRGEELTLEQFARLSDELE